MRPTPSIWSTLRISGLGGTHLEDSGVDLIENIVDRAVMGVGPVLAQLPFYIKLIGRYLDWIDREKPDLIILVDNPGLNILLAEAAKKRKIPVLYYICPQYWAWGPWRLRRFARAVDVAFAILPFEPPLFWNAGIPTGFAGHPMLAPGSAPKETLAALESETREAEDILALLPGSRKAEIEKHLLPMLTLYAKLRSERGVRAAIIPQKNKERRRHVQAILDQQRALGRLPEGVTALECSATDILGTARLAIAKSGTICLETAITGTPLVVVYKLSNMLDRFFSKNLLSVPWFAAPNLVLGRSAIPEFRVDSASMWEEEIFQAAKELWDEGPARARQLRDLRELRERLAGSGAAKELVRWILGGKGA